MQTYLKNQIEFKSATDEECEESLEAISKLFDELYEETEKWVARDDYSIANDLSGGHLTIDQAKELFYEKLQNRELES